MSYLSDLVADNREENLRNVTRSQNRINSRVCFDNKLGEKNISPTKDGRYYYVQIKRNGKCVFRKHFKKLEDAIMARNEAVAFFQGEFACLEKRNEQ